METYNSTERDKSPFLGETERVEGNKPGLWFFSILYIENIKSIMKYLMSIQKKFSIEMAQFLFLAALMLMKLRKPKSLTRIVAFPQKCSTAIYTL